MLSTYRTALEIQAIPEQQLIPGYEFNPEPRRRDRTLSVYGKAYGPLLGILPLRGASQRMSSAVPCLGDGVRLGHHKQQAGGTLLATGGLSMQAAL